MFVGVSIRLGKALSSVSPHLQQKGDVGAVMLGSVKIGK
jgi:hypothetical protein